MKWMDLLINILLFIVILGTIIVVHEGGHFYFAKKAGILCPEFSIGMGPVLYKKTKGETTYCLRAIPIGGFVTMAGEEATTDLIKIGQSIGLNFDEDGVVTEMVLKEDLESEVFGEVTDLELYGEFGEELFIKLKVDDKEINYSVDHDAFYLVGVRNRLQLMPYDRCFESKGLFARFKSVIAGPLMNFVLAIVLYLIVAFSTGVVNYDSNVIASVGDGYPASSVGVEAGDSIISFNGDKVESWDDLSDAISNAENSNLSTVSFTVEKEDGTINNYTVDPILVFQGIGITNRNIDSTITYPAEYTGLQIGTVAFNYLDKAKTSTLDANDLIIGYKYVALDSNSNKDISISDLNGKDFTPISSWKEMMELANSLDTSYIIYEYYDANSDSEDKIKETNIIKVFGSEVLDSQNAEKIIMQIGVTAETHFDFLGSIKTALVEFKDDFMMIFNTLGLMIHSDSYRMVGASDLGGFVGIFQLISNVKSSGALTLIAFVAMLSVNIGIINLLPIPALDGGRLVFLLYELITRRKPNKKVENMLTTIVFILLMMFMVYALYNDVLRLMATTFIG